MELWIRSQDKTILSKAQNIIIRENQDENNQTNYAIVDIYTMGIYKTKERALEVLDEIHSCIQTNCLFELYSNMGSFPDDFNKKWNCVPVYEMPKE